MAFSNTNKKVLQITNGKTQDCLENLLLESYIKLF